MLTKPFIDKIDTYHGRFNSSLLSLILSKSRQKLTQCKCLNTRRKQESDKTHLPKNTN